MKRIILFLVSFIFFLLIVLVVTPLIFKGKIDRIIKEKINEAVAAEVNYERYSLSLFRSFPDFNASIKGLSIIGEDGFQGDTLAYLNEVSARIDLVSVLQKEGIVLKKIKLGQSKVQLIENSKGEANWHIKPKKETKESQTAQSEEKESNGEDLTLLLEDIEISMLDFSYLNYKSNYYFVSKEINARLAGEMVGSVTELATVLSSESVNFQYDEIDYLKDKAFQLETVLLADLSDYDFSFKSGNSKINDLPLVVNGGFSMPNDSILFDVDFSIPDIELDDVLDLLPGVYKKYMKDVEAKADVSFTGDVHGIYYKEIYPSFSVNFVVENGNVKYPDLPEQLSINRLNATIIKPEGILDSMKVGVSEMDLMIGENPFKAKALFDHLFTDPGIDMSLNGLIDLATLNKVLPLGDTKMSGTIDSKTKVKGRYSELENNNFSNFYSKGVVTLTHFKLQNRNIPQGMNISDARLSLDNQDVVIRNLKGNIGRSDFTVKGKISKVLTYLFADDELTGAISLNSNLFDANEFLQKSPESRSSNEVYVEIDSTVVDEGPFVLPEKIALTIDANIGHLLFDKMDITGLHGNMELKNQQLALNQLNMSMVGGDLQMNGKVLADGREHPAADLQMKARNFDLPTASRELSIVKKYLPFAEKSQGRFSTDIDVTSQLSDDMKLIASGISAKGKLSTKDLKLVNTQYFQNLKSVLQYQKLRNVEIDDFSAGFSIEQGNLQLKPFSTKVANQPVKLGGTYNLGGTLDFRVDATIDKSLLSKDIQDMIAFIPGHQRVTSVDVGLDIAGDAKKPDVNVDTDKIKQQVISQVKNSSAEELQDAAKKLLNQFFK